MLAVDFFYHKLPLENISRNFFSIKNTIQILQDNWLEQTRHLFLPIEFCFWMHRVEAESNKCKKEYFSVLKLKTKTEQCHKIFYPHFLLKRLKNLFRFWFDCKIQNSVFAQSLTTQTHEILAFHMFNFLPLVCRATQVLHFNFSDCSFKVS